MNEFVTPIVNVLIALTLFFSIGFVAVYATSPWKKNRLGKATMTWGVAMIMWCLSGVIFSLGPPWWYPMVRLGAYSATAWAMGIMLTTLVQVQRRVREEMDEDKTSIS